MKCVLQVVSHRDGRRMQSVTMTRSEFAGVLRRCLEDAPQLADSYVLVLADDVKGDGNVEDFRLCHAPMMRVSTFIDHFGDTDHVPAASRPIEPATLYGHPGG